ncbi:MAG TPA: hypothetical protein VFL36_04225 [Myxococcales bacterium]|nr:hypothetical protein [Myxococcales bacterium]
MEPLLQSVTTTVAQDVRELMHAAELEEPRLIEKDPPNWHWGLPLGFVTVAAAGALLIAAAGVQERIQEQKQGVRRHARTKMHMKKVRPQPAPVPPGAS